MTISTTTPANPSLARAHVTWFGTFRSEWTKFWSLRSTYIIIAVAAVVMIGFSFLIAMAIRQGLREAGGFVQVPGLSELVAEVIAWISLEGIMFAQLAIGVLGVLLVSGEYSTGMIRATMTAVPKRIPVLVMKAAVLVVTTLLTMIPISIVAFLAAQGQYSEFGLDAKLTDPGVGRIILGVALYLCAIGVIGSGLWLALPQRCRRHLCARRPAPHPSDPAASHSARLGPDDRGLPTRCGGPVGLRADRRLRHAAE